MNQRIQLTNPRNREKLSVNESEMLNLLDMYFGPSSNRGSLPYYNFQSLSPRARQTQSVLPPQQTSLQQCLLQIQPPDSTKQAQG